MKEIEGIIESKNVENNYKDSLKNYQKVIKSSLRDATNYFGFIKGNPAGDMQIPRVLTFE